MPKYRRGSTYWTSELSKMIDTYKEGDLVSYVGVSANTLYGVVSRIDKVCNKVNVSWNGGSDKQHTPDELTLILDADPQTRGRFASEIEAHGRSALYHAGKGRKYRKTKKEIESGIMQCPKCKEAMETKKYTKSSKIHDCGGCGFKVTSDNIVSEKDDKKPEAPAIQNMNSLVKRRGSVKKIEGADIDLNRVIRAINESKLYEFGHEDPTYETWQNLGRVYQIAMRGDDEGVKKEIKNLLVKFKKSQKDFAKWEKLAKELSKYK